MIGMAVMTANKSCYRTMSRNFLWLVCLFLLGCEAKQAQPKIESKADKFSYGVGVELGKELRFLRIKYPELNTDLVARGVKDVLERRNLLVSERELRKVKLLVESEIMESDVEARSARDPEFGAMIEKNSAEEQAFLAKNRQRSAVQVTESGLQFEILAEGNGKQPKEKDEVLIRFTGTLLDGTEFDSSQKSHNGPAKFRVQHLIPGMVEALLNMQEGSRWKIYVPAKLAYGMRGRQPHIGPAAMLVFDIELLQVIPNRYEYQLK